MSISFVFSAGATCGGQASLAPPGSFNSYECEVKGVRLLWYAGSTAAVTLLHPTVSGPPISSAVACLPAASPANLPKVKIASKQAVVARPQPPIRALQELGLDSVANIDDARSRARKMLPRKGGKKATNEAVMAPATRLKRLTVEDEFQDFVLSDLTVKNEKIWCVPCADNIVNHKSTILKHLKSDKHKDRRQLAKSRNASRLQMAHVVKEWFELNPSAPFQKLDEEVMLYRVCTIRDWLKAGLPLGALTGDIKARLEAGNFSLGSEGHFGQLVPILKLELSTKITKLLYSEEELWNAYDPEKEADVFGPCRPYSITFDGQSNLCEVMNLMQRTVVNFKPMTQCIRLSLLKGSQDHQQLARWILENLFRVKAEPTACLCATPDRAATNGAAVRLVQRTYPNIVHIGCQSHTLDHVGDHLDIPLLKEFSSALHALFGPLVTPPFVCMCSVLIASAAEKGAQCLGNILSSWASSGQRDSVLVAPRGIRVRRQERGWHRRQVCPHSPGARYLSSCQRAHG